MWYQRVIEYQYEDLLDPHHDSANMPQPPRERWREETERDAEPAHFRRVRLNCRDSAPPPLPSPTFPHALTDELLSTVEWQWPRSDSDSSVWAFLDDGIEENPGSWPFGIPKRRREATPIHPSFAYPQPPRPRETVPWPFYKFQGQGVSHPMQSISQNKPENLELAADVVKSA